MTIIKKIATVLYIMIILTLSVFLALLADFFVVGIVVFSICISPLLRKNEGQ